VIKVKVFFSGILSEIVGVSIDYLELSEPVDTEKLIEILASKYKGLREWLSRLPLLQVNLNGIDVTMKKIQLRDGDEVVLSAPLYEGG
jgi:molybdopterin converting factor small subunit